MNPINQLDNQYKNIHNRKLFTYHLSCDSKIDNAVSSPQLGYHCMFVNVPLYVIVFVYRLFIDLVFFLICSLIDDRSLFGIYFNKNYLLTVTMT